jgi:hypothetical protein
MRRLARSERGRVHTETREAAEDMSSTVRVLTGELGERMARICLRTASSFRMRSASLRSFQIDSSDGRSERGAGVRSGAGRRSVGESTRDSTLGRFADHCTDGWSCRCYCAPTATTNAGAQRCAKRCAGETAESPYGLGANPTSTAAHLGQRHIVVVIAASSLMRAACSRAAERTRA